MASSATPVDTRNIQYKVVLGTVFGLVIANGALALRLLARRVGRISLKLDDYLMCFAVVCDASKISFSPDH
jgi:hypothetical protein